MKKGKSVWCSFQFFCKAESSEGFSFEAALPPQRSNNGQFIREFRQKLCPKNESEETKNQSDADKSTNQRKAIWIRRAAKIERIAMRETDWKWMARSAQDKVQRNNSKLGTGKDHNLSISWRDYAFCPEYSARKHKIWAFVTSQRVYQRSMFEVDSEYPIILDFA